ncbi:MAG: alpha/beta fold hydrolase [Planctomycetes bacterium]|nr:alpha/beta fold hydrolase [Planctomycetota bacterium]
MHRFRALIVAALPVLAACSLGERFLVPSPAWVAEPSALGLAFDDVELATGSDTTVHGWFLPSADSDGRTVVLCHGNAANISFYHPYYRFLHDAGFHVFLFDYRGYGRSRGELSVDALLTDTEAALRYVFARPDVDGGKVMLFGMSLGAIVALHAAAEHPELAGLVIENASSPHALLQRAAGGFLTFWAELLALPGSLEPVDNAARHRGPALFVCGAWDPQLLEHLDAAAAHAGPTANWVQPETGHAPAGLLRHDGEYQDSIVRFLRGCADGRAPRLEAMAGAVGAGTVDVAVLRRNLGDEPLPVEIALVGDRGDTVFARRWLHGEREVFSLPVTEPPRFVAAWPYARTNGDAQATTWEPMPGPLKQAADTLPILRSLAAMAIGEAEPLRPARSFVRSLAWHEREHGPLPALAAAELVPELVTVGRVLAGSDAADDRLLARDMLRRAVAAEPADARLHYWPASRYVVGFAHGAEVAAARALLQSLGD